MVVEKSVPQVLLVKSLDSPSSGTLEFSQDWTMSGTRSMVVPCSMIVLSALLFTNYYTDEKGKKKKKCP